MKVKIIVPLIIILSALYLSATTISVDNSGIRAIGFIVGVMSGYAFRIWLEDNL